MDGWGVGRKGIYCSALLLLFVVGFSLVVRARRRRIAKKTKEKCPMKNHDCQLANDSRSSFLNVMSFIYWMLDIGG